VLAVEGYPVALASQTLVASVIGYQLALKPKLTKPRHCTRRHANFPTSRTFVLQQSTRLTPPYSTSPVTFHPNISLTMQSRKRRAVRTAIYLHSTSSLVNFAHSNLTSVARMLPRLLSVAKPAMHSQPSLAARMENHLHGVPNEETTTAARTTRRMKMRMWTWRTRTRTSTTRTGRCTKTG